MRPESDKKETPAPVCRKRQRKDFRGQRREGSPLTSELQARPEPTLAMVPDAFDATNGVETPFGHRWGGDVIRLSAEHLAALQAGQTLALDVQDEYVVFLKCAEFHRSEEKNRANLKGVGLK